jgi:hypothetical protein
MYVDAVYHVDRADERECQHVSEPGHSSQTQVVVAERETVDHPHRYYLDYPGYHRQ